MVDIKNFDPSKKKQLDPIERFRRKYENGQVVEFKKQTSMSMRWATNWDTTNYTMTCDDDNFFLYHSNEIIRNPDDMLQSLNGTVKLSIGRDVVIDGIEIEWETAPESDEISVNITTEAAIKLLNYIRNQM